MGQQCPERFPWGHATTVPYQMKRIFVGRAAFEGMFNDPQVPTDPGDVVEQFVALIDIKPGTRPFRTVVGVDVGVRDCNAFDEPHEAPFLQMMGLEEFVKLRTE